MCEQSRKAIVLIRASETLVSINGATSTSPDETTYPDIPMIVIDTVTGRGQTYGAAMTLGIILPICDSGKIVKTTTQSRTSPD